MLPCTTSITTFMTVPSITFSNAAPLFAIAAAPDQPQPSVRPKSASKPPPPKKGRGIATTPHEVNIDYLTRELAFAKTKITSLEASLKDRDERIELMKERVRSMEEPMNASLRSQYLNPVLAPARQTQSAGAQAAPPADAQAAHSAVPQAAAPSFQDVPAPPQVGSGAIVQSTIEGVLAELSLIRQQVASLQCSVANIQQPGNQVIANPASPQVAQVAVSSPAQPVSTGNPQHRNGPPRRGRGGPPRPSAQAPSLPIYGEGCWVNGIPNASIPRRSLLGPPPANFAPWSWMPTARATKLSAPPTPQPRAPQPARGNVISRSTGPSKSHPSRNIQHRVAGETKRHIWTNKGCKLGGEAALAGGQSLRDQRVAALTRRDLPPQPSPPPSSSPPATAPSGALTALPNIPVQNRFQVISEEGN